MDTNITETKPESQTIIYQSNPNYLIELAINKDADVDKLEKLMQLKERWDKEEARKAFISAMAKFQSICPPILRQKEGGRTKAGKLAYKFAPIDVIEATTRDARKECGFSYTFDTPKMQTEGVEVIIKISHEQGHYELHSVFMPWVTDNTLLSPPQRVGATMSYAKRYAFQNGFGIVTADDDNDAITPELQEVFEKRIEKWGSTAYIKSKILLCQNRDQFQALLEYIPTTDQSERAYNITMALEKLDKNKFWNDWEKHSKDTAEKLLTALETKYAEQIKTYINKIKETTNE